MSYKTVLDSVHAHRGRSNGDEASSQWIETERKWKIVKSLYLHVGKRQGWNGAHSSNNGNIKKWEWITVWSGWAFEGWKLFEPKSSSGKWTKGFSTTKALCVSQLSSFFITLANISKIPSKYQNFKRRYIFRDRDKSHGDIFFLLLLYSLSFTLSFTYRFYFSLDNNIIQTFHSYGGGCT